MPIDFMVVKISAQGVPIALVPKISIITRYGKLDKIMPDNISDLFLFVKSVEKLIKYLKRVSVIEFSEQINRITPAMIPIAIASVEIAADLSTELMLTDGFDITALIFTLLPPYRLKRLFTAKIPPIAEVIIKTIAVIKVFILTLKSHKMSEIRIVTALIGSV